MPLPTKLKVPPNNINEYILFIAGEKKVGKTSFCTQFPDHFIMEFECGNCKHLLSNHEDITSLKVFDELLRELEKNPDYCKTLIIDEVQILYKRIWLSIIKREGISYPGDVAYGKVWSAIGDTFDAYVDRICALKPGIIFTGHTKVKEIPLRSGRTISKLEAGISGRVNETLDRIVQLWGVILFGKEGERELHIKGTEYLKASHGFDNNFKNVTEGYIDLGSSPQEGYKNFVAAWNNEGIKTVKPTPSSNAKPKFKIKRKIANG